MMTAFDRRRFLASGALLGAATLSLPKMVFARANTAKRLLFILQRGAADGLATLAPVGDPDFARHRAQFADIYADAPQLDGFFALHPALHNIGSLYASKDALFVHAVSCSHRERSHFDAQNILESGGARAYATRDGWLNRLIGLLPADARSALALSPVVPLALQGAQPSSSYAPSALPDASEDLLRRVSGLYQSDPTLSMLWDDALKTRAMAGDTDMRNLRNAQAAGTLAASLMTGPDSARIMMIESNGWDSHSGQAGQLNRSFGSLDALVGAYKQGLGAEWDNTLVMIATEFGRTVAVNGTRGTDHGTASAAMLLGGGVNGGRIMADWPGLRAQDLFENRDLMPTASLEAVLAGATADHFGLDPALTMQKLFPQRTVKAMGGLIS